MQVIKDIETCFLPSMHRMAEEIAREFKNIQTFVSSAPLGSKTANKAHILTLECLFKSAVIDQIDNVAFYINVEHLNTHPTLNAGVCWGHPSGFVEAELFQNSVKFTERTIKELEGGLPQLYEALKAAIRRGHPPVLNDTNSQSK